jgi:tetratricopeptide (TPR) repeat protein
LELANRRVELIESDGNVAFAIDSFEARQSAVRRVSRDRRLLVRSWFASLKRHVRWSLAAVAVINRLLRQQLVREAEGYLDLASAMGETWQLPSAIRDRLAYRSLAVIDRLGENASLSPQIQLIKGQALRMLELYKEALQPLSAAAEADPQNIDTWLALGWCHKRTGRIDLAIESLEEALDLEPGSALVNYNLACYWSLAQNKRQALAYLAQALSLDSGFRHLIDEEHDFDPLRADPDFQAIASITV